MSVLVRRKDSAKRKRGYYKTVEFYAGGSIKEIVEFLGDLGDLMIIDGTCGWISMKDGRKIIPPKHLLKDRQGRILSFSIISFCELFEEA